MMDNDPLKESPFDEIKREKKKKNWKDIFPNAMNGRGKIKIKSPLSLYEIFNILRFIFVLSVGIFAVNGIINETVELLKEQENVEISTEDYAYVSEHRKFCPSTANTLLENMMKDHKLTYGEFTQFKIVCGEENNTTERNRIIKEIEND